MSLLVHFANIIKGSDVPNLPQLSAGDKNIQNGLDVLYEIIGALAFLMIVIAALRYIVNADDPNKISEAKRMIVYTLVGLGIVVLAATIVGYVLGA